MPHVDNPDIPGYKIIRRLGEDVETMTGLTFIARQESTNTRRLVKILKPSFVRNVQNKALGTSFLQDFADEAKISLEVSHPNVIKVIDRGATAYDGLERVPYYVMELVEPKKDLLEFSQDAQIDTIIDVVQQVLEGTLSLHKKNVVHMDLKPANILVNTIDNTAKIIDLGFAKVLRKRANKTDFTYIRATKGYVPPNLHLGAHALTKEFIVSGVG